MAVPVFFFMVWAVYTGVGLLGRDSSPNMKRFGAFLIVLSGLVPIACWFGPSILARGCYGRYPLGSYPEHIRVGMTADHVMTVLGAPHERYRQKDGERWCYWIDSFGFTQFRVDIGPNRLVTATQGN
jgi:hypothetical protein